MIFRSIYRPAVLLITAALFSACESGWQYYWIVENHTGDTLRVVTTNYFEANLMPRDTRGMVMGDTIPPHSQRLIAKYGRLNGGPPSEHDFDLSLYRRDSIIFRELQRAFISDWQIDIDQAWPWFSYDVDIRLEVADTGVVRRDRAIRDE